MHVKIECMLRCTDRVWMLHSYSAWSNPPPPKFHKIKIIFLIVKVSKQATNDSWKRNEEKKSSKLKVNYFGGPVDNQTGQTRKDCSIDWSAVVWVWKPNFGSFCCSNDSYAKLDCPVTQWNCSFLAPTHDCETGLFNTVFFFCTVSPDHGQINCGVLGPPSISPADSPESEEISL